MVLTDREIELALRNKHILVEPLPPLDAIASTALDLTLGISVLRWKSAATPGVIQEVSPATPGYKVNSFIKEFTEPKPVSAEGFLIAPGEFLLGWTAEQVTIPLQSRLAARVEGKSSLARLGVGVHITAPTIHAGFSGQIQLELCNHGRWTVRLIPGMRICQLIFEQTLGTPNSGYSGQFQNQAG